LKAGGISIHVLNVATVWQQWGCPDGVGNFAGAKAFPLGN
jgi:hypothetical protein